jgi:hypothetical protein
MLPHEREADVERPREPAVGEPLSAEERDETTEEVAARTLGLVQVTLIAVAVVALAVALLVFLLG